MYFVALCTTASAPRCSGCCRYGVANVLSTQTIAPWLCATSLTASMSTTRSSGLVGDSSHTKRVDGVIAFSTASRSVASTAVKVSPNRFITLSNSRNVPPYTSSMYTTWSPGLRSSISVDSAPRPDANARQCLASSSAARFSSSAERVGLPLREYSKPWCLPTPCCAKVVARWIGCTTAPVAGSGPWPTWTARVAKPHPSLDFLSVKSALSAMRDELEQVGARDHGHGLARLHHEDRLLAAQKGLERVVDRGVDTDLAQRGIHRRRNRGRHDRRIVVDAVEQRALLQRADYEVAVGVFRHRQLGDAVSLHQVDRIADAAAGLDGDQRRHALRMLGQHLADAHRAQAREESVLPHPFVVKELAQVVAAGVREQHHDHVVRTAVAGHHESRVHGHARRPAHEDALLARQPARGHERLLVVDLHDLVDELDVHRSGHEVLADSLDLVRADSARVDRAFRVGADDLDRRLPFL